MHVTKKRKIKIKVYFADAYAAWQRGRNENSNGLLRENQRKQIRKKSNDDLKKNNTIKRDKKMFKLG